MPDEDLKLWSDFYLSEKTIEQGRILAKQQDDRARAILNTKNVPLVELVKNLLYDNDTKITELAYILYRTEESNEAQVYDVTNYIDIGNRFSNSLAMKKNDVEDIVEYMNKLGYIPTAHAHTHGQTYSNIAERVEPNYQNLPEATLKGGISDALNGVLGAEKVGNPSDDDHFPHFFYDYRAGGGFESYASRIQFIFTNKGFTVYSSDVNVNKGDFLTIKIKKGLKHKTKNNRIFKY